MAGKEKGTNQKISIRTTYKIIVIYLREQSHLKLYKKRLGQCSMMFSRVEKNISLADVVDDSNDKDILAILNEDFLLVPLKETFQ